jgi:hypothetical protein
MNVDMVLTYLDFVVDRHRVWELRQAGQPQHWSNDPILRRNKFTNVYRVLDYGSQFLLTELLNEPGIGPEDALGRSFLYRMSNEPKTWQHTKAEWGLYPRAHNFTPDLGKLWADYRDAGNRVFSGAYTIMPLPGVGGFDKAREVVRMAATSFHPDSPTNVIEAFRYAPTMAERFKVLRGIPNVGDFIAMQVLTDFGYSPFGADQDENAFVVAGPGARKGAKELFPDKKVAWVIQWCREQVLQLPDCPMLQGRPPSLMDIQNTLCEFSKYARFLRAPEPARMFKPLHPGKPVTPVLPGHWVTA